MGIFGWSYPPGCSSIPGDPGYCEICGKDVDDCVCPECPLCGEYGNPKCYGGTPESIAAMAKFNELQEKIMEIMKKHYDLHGRCFSKEEMRKEQEPFFLEMDKIEDLAFQGHGLEITQQQIESFNDSWDRIEEADRQEEEDERQHPEFFGGEK